MPKIVRPACAQTENALGDDHCWYRVLILENVSIQGFSVTKNSMGEAKLCIPEKDPWIETLSKMVELFFTLKQKVQSNLQYCMPSM